MALTSGSPMREWAPARPVVADAGEAAMSGIDVYALWRLPARQAIASFGAGTSWHGSADEEAAPRLGVAAVMPDQTLEYADLAALEQAGLLVIEVPDALRGADAEALRRYLGSQLADIQAAAGPVPAPPLAAGEPDVTDYGPLQSPFGLQAERLYLDALNDPQPADELG